MSKKPEPKQAQAFHLGSMAGRVTLHEHLHDQKLSDDIEAKFRALAAEGLINAIEHAIDGNEEDFAAATIGICEGVANAFVSLISPMSHMQQKRLLAILIFCLEEVLSQHPHTQKAAPHFRAGFKAMLKALGFAKAQKLF